jgi:hypothetical protein
MNKGVKIALIIIVCLFLGLIGVCGAGFLLFKSNMPDMDKLKDDLQATKHEGEAFGASRQDQECVSESIARVDRCTPEGPLARAMCNARQGVFLDGCLDKAHATPALCEGAPKSYNIMEIATWSVRSCEHSGHGGQQGCAQLMNRIHDLCMRRAGLAPKLTTGTSTSPTP